MAIETEHKEKSVRKFLWPCGLILGLAGCASKPEIVITGLPLAGEVRGASASVTEASLQEAGVSERDDRIVVARVSLRNRTGKVVPFGPEHVYLADATGELFLRISEKWLRDYYNARIRGFPAKSPPEAIAPFPSGEVKVGDAELRSPALTPAQKGELAEEMAELVEEALVRPRRDAPGTFLDKGVEGTLGVLLKQVTLKPDHGLSGFIYFYHSAATKPQYPVRLIMDLDGEVSAFLFQ